MTAWVRADWFRDPRVMRLYLVLPAPEAARAVIVWFASLVAIAESGTRSIVSDEAVDGLFGAAGAPGVPSALVEVGLWRRVSGGFKVVEDGLAVIVPDPPATGGQRGRAS